jgi:hypothetical protein
VSSVDVNSVSEGRRGTSASHPRSRTFHSASLNPTASHPSGLYGRSPPSTRNRTAVSFRRCGNGVRSVKSWTNCQLSRAVRDRESTNLPERDAKRINIAGNRRFCVVLSIEVRLMQLRRHPPHSPPDTTSRFCVPRRRGVMKHGSNAKIGQTSDLVLVNQHVDLCRTFVNLENNDMISRIPL